MLKRRLEGWRPSLLVVTFFFFPFSFFDKQVTEIFQCKHHKTYLVHEMPCIILMYACIIQYSNQEMHIQLFKHFSVLAVKLFKILSPRFFYF